MKTSFTLGMFFFYQVISFAQSPVLTGSNTNLQVGESLTAQAFAYTAPGSSGVSQTWDFSTVTSPGSGNFSTIDPSTTVNAANFPLATVTTRQTSSTPAYNYYLTSGSSIDIEGYVFANGMVLSYTNTALQLTYPFAFDSTFTDTYSGTYLSGGNTITRSGNITVTADAYGTLILPYDTFYNVLRVLSVDGFAETPATTNSSTTIYSWYLPGIHYPILQLSSVSFNGNVVSQSGSYLDALSSTPFLAAPSNLTTVVLKTEASYVQLNWMDNSNNETGFKIERSTNDTVYTMLDSVAANVTTYNDNNITQSTSYYYRVYGYNSQRNSNFTNIVAVNTGSTGIAGITNRQLNVYPNPVNSILFFENLPSNAIIKISDSEGRILANQKTSGITYQLNMSNYSSGVYLAQISTDSEIFVTRIIK